MAIAVGTRIEIAAYAQEDEQTAVNILHLECTSQAGGPFSEQDVAVAYAGFVKTQYAALMNQNATFRGVTLRRWTGTAWTGYYYAKLAVVGTGGVEALPRQSAGLISWRTAISGRHGRGRTYVPFPSEDHNGVTAKPTAAYMTALNDLANKLQNTGAMTVSGLNTATFNLQIYNRVTHEFTPVDHNVQPQKWATQRRRGSFGRPNVPPDGLAG